MKNNFIYRDDKGSFVFQISRLERAFWFFEGIVILIFFIRLPVDSVPVNLAVFSMVLFLLLVHIKIKKRKIESALVLLVVGVSVLGTWLMWMSGGMFDETILVFPVLMVFCGLLRSKRLFFMLWVYFLVNLLLLAYSNHVGWIIHISPANTVSSGILIGVLMSLLAGLIWLVTKNFNDLLTNLDTENKRVKLSEEKIKKIVNHDYLTGLPNRLYANKYFDKLIVDIKSSRKIGLLFLDLDNFKSINDTFGHSSGDAVLQQMAQRLEMSVGREGVVCRQGGDEFLIVLNDIKQNEEVTNLVTNMLRDVSKTIYIEGLMFINTVSIGIAIAPDNGRNFEELSKKADIALFEAKDLGRNCYTFFDENMIQGFEKNAMILSDLRQALVTNELELYYQPKLKLSDGSVSGVECLIRWNHPERGLVYPSDFISIAESSDVIFDLGTWVIRQACRQCRAWLDQGFEGLSVAVNVSNMQFKRGDVAKIVTQALTDFQIPPSLLILEITESTLIDDSIPFRTSLSAVSGCGVELAIDDFGTGYSNLGYLKKMSVGSMKIDQSFVQNLLANAQDKAIVQTIIEMGKTLKLDIVAEGIEDKKTADVLAEMGCQYGQGWYWAKALPVRACTDYMIAKRAALSR